MSEKISIEEACGNGSVGNCLLHAMSEYKHNANDWAKEFKIIPGQTKEIEVCLTVNGVEVRLGSFLDQFVEQHERMLTEKANEILKERLWEMEEKFEKIREAMKGEFSKMFPEYKDERW